MASFDRDELLEARRAIESVVNKCEKAFGKLAAGTSQHTLMKRRLAAFRVALELIDEKLCEQGEQ